MTEETQAIITLIVELVIIGVITTVIILWRYKLKTKRKNYINKLNEHDKAVILDYQQIKAFEKEEEEK